jgi:hypothetical protein
MQTIAITLAEPGMIVAEDIMPLNKPNGIPVLGQGSPLTAQIIERLKNIGIQSITVAGHPINLPGEETLEQALASLEDRFDSVRNDPYMMTILALLRKQIRQRYSKTP